MNKPCGESGRPGPSGDGNRERGGLYHLFQSRARIFFREVKFDLLMRYLNPVTGRIPIWTQSRRNGNSTDKAVIRSELADDRCGALSSGGGTRPLRLGG
jgi:hypothetical protein